MLFLARIGKVFRIIILCLVIVFTLICGLEKARFMEKHIPSFHKNKGIHAIFETGPQELDLNSAILISLCSGATIRMLRVNRKKELKYN